MFEIDHSVVFRRQNAVQGSGTVVHFSSTFIVLEIYDRRSSVLLNEVFHDICITNGRAILYDGGGVVCNVMDYSSLQIVTLFLTDSWIALGNRDLNAENRFEAERFIDLCQLGANKYDKLQARFYDFLRLLTQMINGLEQSEREYEFEPYQRREAALSVMAERLNETYLRLEQCIDDCDEDTMMLIGELYKQHLYPISANSKVFQAFHANGRIPYLNEDVQKLLRTKDDFWSGPMGGVLLDTFFAKYGDLNFSEKRTDYFARKLEEQIENKAGKCNLLFIGTDLSLARILESLPNELISGANIKLISFFSESFEEINVQVNEIIRNKGVSVEYSSKAVDFDLLMKALYQKRDMDFGEYDQIFMASALDPLSSKVMLYFIQFLLTRLKPDGALNLFTDDDKESSIRNHWLLYFCPNFNSPNWEQLLTGCSIQKEHNLGFGTYTCITIDEEDKHE